MTSGRGKEGGVKYVVDKFDQYGNNGTRLLVNTRIMCRIITDHTNCCSVKK